MTTDRSYRRGDAGGRRDGGAARNAGTQFSPAVVAAFLAERAMLAPLAA
jgi:hypothetical protein